MDKPRHDAMCHRLPPPVELAQMFLDEETTRPTTMSKRLLGYQSPYFINRLDHGLALLGLDRAWKYPIRPYKRRQERG